MGDSCTCGQQPAPPRGIDRPTCGQDVFRNPISKSPGRDFYEFAPKSVEAVTSLAAFCKVPVDFGSYTSGRCPFYVIEPLSISKMIQRIVAFSLKIWLSMEETRVYVAFLRQIRVCKPAKRYTPDKKLGARMESLPHQYEGGPIVGVGMTLPQFLHGLPQSECFVGML